MTTAPVDAPAADASRWDAVALELARRRPEAYSLVAHGLRPAPHHRRWLAALRETVETPGGRLLLIAPPGSGKSSFTSLVLPPWYLGNHPDHAVLAVTSSDVMASEFGGVVDLTLRTNEAHRAVFPALAARPDAARGWSRDGLYLQGVAPETKDPSYRCTGFGSSVIGSRANLLLLDDPLTQEMATSEAEMARARRYVDLTLLTRLQPQGAALAIMTRFGEADLAAHLIAQGWRTEIWPQLSGTYPGADRDAEGRAPLWPGRFPLAWVQAEHARLGTAQFELVHQGNPLLMGGAIYRTSTWFKDLPPTYVSAIAPRCTTVTFVDTAFSAKQDADFTCAVTLAFDPHDPQRRVYLTGLFRKRIEEEGLPEALAAHLILMQPHAVGVELPAFRQESTQGLVLRLRELLWGKLATDVRAVGVSTDKTVRARFAAARAEAGLLYVDKALPEWPAAERELLSFPVARNDDVSDALAGACVLALGPVGQEATARPVRMRFG